MAAESPHWSVENEDKSARWTRSDRGAQQEDAARHSEVGVSEPTNLGGHQLGVTEGCPGRVATHHPEAGGGGWLTLATRGVL